MPLHPLLISIVCLFLYNVVYLTGGVIACCLAGITIEEISLALGPAPIRFRVAGISFRLGILPTSSSIRMRVIAADDEFGPVHPLRWVAVFLAGPLCGFLLAVSCLRPLAAEGSLRHGFAQVFQGLSFGSPKALALVGRFFAMADQRPSFIVLGVVAAKFTAFNLLPIPPLAGGQVLMRLLGGRQGMPERLATPVAVVGLLFVVVLFFGWVVTIGRCLAGRG